MGGIRLELLTDLTATRADAEGQLSPEDFKIEIVNPQGVILKRWDTYAEYMAQESTVFAMNAGGPYTYSMPFSLSENRSSLCSLSR